MLVPLVAEPKTQMRRWDADEDGECGAEDAIFGAFCVRGTLVLILFYVALAFVFIVSFSNGFICPLSRSANPAVSFA